MYDEKQKIIEDNIRHLIKERDNEDMRIKYLKSNFLKLKELFSSNFNNILEEIQVVINSISIHDAIKEDNDNESPASKIKMLSLNWIDDGYSTKLNEVINERQNVKNYWLARSEEVLDGAFLCKILVENITHNSAFNHGAGILKHDLNVNNDGFYAYACCLYLSNGDLNQPFVGNPSGIKLDIWRNGDEIIIKRDSDNDLWFGLNDETKLVKSTNVPGPFRIVLGFLNASQENEVFKMVYLQNI